MEEKEMLYQGRKLFYRLQKGWPLVVLVHGFPEDGSIWEAQVSALGGYGIIVPDLPGSGRSETIADMTMEGMAGAIKGMLDAEHTGTAGKQKVTMIGHSMGGYITLAFAEKYPDLLNGIGLFHSTASADSVEKRQARKRGIEHIRHNGPRAFLENTIRNLFAAETREKRPDLIQEQIGLARNFLGETLVSYYEGMMKRPDRTKILTESKLPVLFILGKSDTAVPLEEGLKLCHLPEISYIEILEHSAHMGMQEEPEKSNEALINFLHYIEKSESDQ